MKIKLTRSFTLAACLGCLSFQQVSRGDAPPPPAKMAESGSSSIPGFFLLIGNDYGVIRNDYGCYRTGEKIRLTAWYVNTTDKPIDLLVGADFEDIKVTREDGSPVQLTPGIRVGMISATRVENYNCEQIYLLLSDTFDMASPGKYKIVLTRSFVNKTPRRDKAKPIELSEGGVTSNTITVEVVGRQ